MSGEFSAYECEMAMECGGICVRLYGHQGEHQCVGGHLYEIAEGEDQGESATPTSGLALAPPSVFRTMEES